MDSVKNDVHGDITVGRILTWTKEYTEGEVCEFYALAGNPVDTVPEYLPYLLVIAPLTKLGGDLNYLSGRMDWRTSRPVRWDETITAELEVTQLEPTGGMSKITFEGRVRCGEEIVVQGRSMGFVIAD
jgi:hypothetical protein